MTIGFYQFQPRFGDVPANLAHLQQALDGVKADLLVLPELCTTGYQFVSKEETLALSEPFPEGVSVRGFQGLAASTGATIIAGFAERLGEKCYNSAVLCTPKGEVFLYRKLHLFYEETLYFTPGDLPLPVIDVGGCKVGVMICFDWVFPEAARTLALGGADIIAHPSNIVMPYNRDMMPMRAFENRVFIVTANRYGTDAREGAPSLLFMGESQILGIKGEVLARAPKDQDALMLVEIDPTLARNKQLNVYNELWEARRPEFYRSK